MSKNLYKNGKEVCGFQNEYQGDNNPSPIVNSEVKLFKKCPRKNYFKNSEDYVFFSGTVRPPFNMEREFHMQGVT